MKLSTTGKLGFGLVALIVMLAFWMPSINQQRQQVLVKQSTNHENEDEETILSLSSSPHQKPLPQVIGIGNKKCSTGALMMYLCAHPKLKCALGEVHYFDHNFDKGVEWYKSRIPPSKPDETTFEKTPKYFTLKSVPRRIKETYGTANQSVKFILMLCDPALRTLSDYKHFMHTPAVPETKKRAYSSFDDYISRELEPFKKFLTNTGLQTLESYDDSYYEDIIKGKWDRLLKGLYAYHLKRWYKYFPKENILILDGDLLTKSPWIGMGKVQDFLQIPHLIKKKNFAKNKKTGFYCIAGTVGSSCLGKGKGRTRILEEDGSISSKMSENTQKLLSDFYRPYNFELSRITNQNFSWIPKQNVFEN